MADPCKKILTDEGIHHKHAEEIIDLMKSGKSRSQITKEIKDGIGVRALREESSKLSKTRGTEYLEWFDNVASSLKRPYKRLFDSWVGAKNSITSNAQTCQKSRASMIASETGMTNFEMFWLINHDTSFQKAFVRELHSSSGQVTKNHRAYLLSESVKKHRSLQLKESNLYGS